MSHVRSQFSKPKALVLPAAISIFKGYGQMDSVNTIKGNIWVRKEEEVKIAEEPVVEPVLQLHVPEE